MTFTDLGLSRLQPPRRGQTTYWDAGTKGQLGLSLLVSSGGTKTFRATSYLHGKAITRKLGRFPEMDLSTARQLTLEDRRIATSGVDPRQARKPASDIFEDVVDQFIEQYAKPRQRSWAETKRVLTRNCAGWLKKPIHQITKRDAYDLLDGFKADGHPVKAANTLAWMRTLWRWAWERDLVASPIMDTIKIHIERTHRERVYSDDEIRSIWQAAGSLGRVEGGYVKLLLLLAPRKTALAKATWAQLDDVKEPTVWTTPFELTKSRKTTARKRVYLTPLPPLAQEVVKALPRGQDTASFLFPGRNARSSLSPTGPLTKKLVAAGAPKDFGYHAVRHTVATWLQNHNRSEYEVGLVLNHSSSSVTAGYSHGYPLDLKKALLTEWADHVGQLVKKAPRRR